MAMFPKEALTGDNNRRKTIALFLELGRNDEDREQAIFTMKEYEYRGRLSFPKLYRLLTDEDPTEYTFALEVFDSWDHWLLLCDSPNVRPYIDKLREENIVRQKSKAVRLLAEEVKNNGKAAFSAAKLLIEKGWMDPEATRKRVGRPHKSDIAKAKEEERKVAQALQSDAARLGLNISRKMN